MQRSDRDRDRERDSSLPYVLQSIFCKPINKRKEKKSYQRYQNHHGKLPTKHEKLKCLLTVGKF